MNILHDFNDDNSLDCLMGMTYITYQSVGRSGRTTSVTIECTKEITMPAHGYTTIWGTHIGAGRVQDVNEWYQQLNEWWVAHKAARHEARLATLKARWDAKRETVRLFHADAALDLVAAAHARSTTTALCDLGV